jgi:hypothetical protein
MSELAIVFSVTLITSIVKRWVEPKWGKVGVQVFVFLLAGLIALWTTYSAGFPALSEIVGETIKVFSLAVALYEVLLKKFDFFKGQVVI